MKNLKILLLCICFGLAQISPIDGQKTLSEKTNSVTTNKAFPDVFRPVKNLFRRIFNTYPSPTYCPVPSIRTLIISTDQIISECSSQKNTCTDNLKTIAVFAYAVNPANDVITYGYTVTGGKIIGNGEKVLWDLSNVKPGNYSITAAVDNGCGFFCGDTRTKTITVKECSDCNNEIQ
jgi:hypothetical protein